MRQINKAWLDGRLEDLAPMIHPKIVMVFPGFTGHAQGKEAFLAGFQDFCQNAKTLEYQERDLEADIAADTAVVSFRYEMVYERSGERYRSTGRDLWVFHMEGESWVAIWRAMLDVDEVAA